MVSYGAVYRILKVSLDPHVMSFYCWLESHFCRRMKKATKSEFFFKYKKVQSNYLSDQKNKQPTVKTKIKK